ncbi:MAG TPA: 30S ribosomal protein S12 methylthiotransferase RimO, partial [Burkholderiales bacterium]|nr:30S ribosomal protein S12 methylthiotransferase RimO [Burkholderiales bacterium]
LLRFLEDARLDRVGCFTYSPVEGAAANALPGAVPEEIKEERRHRLMALQERISASRLAARVGSTLAVLVDRADKHGAIARSHADAPEIDGVVYVESRRRLQAGELLQVEVTQSDAHDLWAVPVADQPPSRRKPARAAV